MYVLRGVDGGDGRREEKWFAALQWKEVADRRGGK